MAAIAGREQLVDRARVRVHERAENPGRDEIHSAAQRPPVSATSIFIME
jgi:hypothetical protein